MYAHDDIDLHIHKFDVLLSLGWNVWFWYQCIWFRYCWRKQLSIDVLMLCYYAWQRNEKWWRYWWYVLSHSLQGQIWNVHGEVGSWRNILNCHQHHLLEHYLRYYCQCFCKSERCEKYQRSRHEESMLYLQRWETHVWQILWRRFLLAHW